MSIAKVIGELNEYLTGWVTYFRHAQCRKHLRQLDQWLRRKLRCYRLKQRKRTKSIADFLMEQGVPEWRAWLLAFSGKGWWRCQAHLRPTKRCQSNGSEDRTYQSDQQVYVVNPLKETAWYVARMPGGVRGGGREAPLYSICAPGRAHSC